MQQIQQRFAPTERPVRILQFGEGNFLRAFVDYMVDIANEKGLFDGNIVLIKPIPMGSLEAFAAQDNLYTVCLRGQAEGRDIVENRVVTSVAGAVDSYAQYDVYAAYATSPDLRFIVSNTTEAGIVYSETDELSMCPPASFPGKLTKFLFERATHFDYAPDRGLVMLPVELIDDNGILLKECVLKLARRWNLGDRFLAWLAEACVFASTLVDRIVTGFPRDTIDEVWGELGYEDRLLVTGEPFALWVIESDKDISGELPLDKAGLPVIFTDNQKPYKQRKVRILNGAHTSFALASYLAGNDTVLQSMRDPLILAFLRDTIFGEVIPTLTLPKEDLLSFADSVLDRFRNPFVQHMLLSIALNSVSKWRARCLPSLLDAQRDTGAIPAHLAFSLAALIQFYHGDRIEDGALVATRDSEPYRVLDDAAVLDFFVAHAGDGAATLSKATLANADFWGQDLTQVPGLESTVSAYLLDIQDAGMRGAIQKHFPTAEGDAAHA